MIADARRDLRTQATTDAADEDGLAERYPKAQARDFDGDAKRVTEADALIAYLQMLGTSVDFKLYDDKANIRGEMTMPMTYRCCSRSSPRAGAFSTSSRFSGRARLRAAALAQGAEFDEAARMPLRED